MNYCSRLSTNMCPPAGRHWGAGQWEAGQAGHLRHTAGAWHCRILFNSQGKDTCRKGKPGFPHNSEHTQPPLLYLALPLGNSQLTLSKLSNWEKDRAKFNLEIPTSLFLELFSFIPQATQRTCNKQEYLLGKEQKKLVCFGVVSKTTYIIFILS